MHQETYSPFRNRDATILQHVSKEEYRKDYCQNVAKYNKGVPSSFWAKISSYAQSAYNRSRAASMITDHHTLCPYNIFTLSQCNNGPDISDYKTMSEVFREIALKIFVEDSDIEEDEIVGSLKKKVIKDQIQKCKSEGEIIKILKSILNLYGDDVEIPVINNSQLNNLLEL
ncbi:hypothetical protein BDC45DRAFT_558913 [Circinella umbellata]|nr:hypothetical protein BDC45DRAFT_558913 [Circinella umbellata]